MKSRLLAVILAAVLTVGVTVLYVRLSTHGVMERQPVRVEVVEPLPQVIELYSPIEIILNITAHYVNPFDPSEIDVVMVLKTPEGEVTTVPAFYYQEYRRSLVSGVEQLIAEGTPTWRIRYTPSKVGRHEFSIEVKTRTGDSTKAGPYYFDVIPSGKRGFARVAEDRRYFIFDDGSSQFFVGLNVCWSGNRGTYDYDEWFKALSMAGVNLVRIWMAPWRFGIEWRELGRYDLREAWRLDYVVKLAEKYDIYIILCLMNHGQLSTSINPQWSENPYNRARGGPLAKPEEFWTNEEARELFKRRLRYIVARWGYSTHILAWELWNEVDLTDNYEAVREEVARWHKEMAEYIKSIDPYKRPVTTSFANPNLDPLIWSLESIDFITVHKYGPEGFQDVPGTLYSLIVKKWEMYRKPVLVAEFGIDWRWWDTPLYLHDREGVGLHDGLWAAIMAGSPATGMSWWWDNYIHPYNLYYHFKAISEFLKGVQPAGSGLRTLKATVTSLAAETGVTDVTVFPSLGWARPASNYFVIKLDGTIEGDTTQIPAFIQGRAHPALRNNPTFRATFPQGGRVVVRVNSVSRAGARLAIYLNNELVKQVDLPDRDGKNDAFVREYDMDVAVDVPPGTHEIRIDNLGADWYTIDYVRFEGAALATAKVRVFGLTNGTLALAWVKNVEWSWWNILNNKSVEPARNLVVTMYGLQDGLYKVELFDTRSGLVVRSWMAEAKDGAMEVYVGDVTDDIAVRAVKVG
ncbi:MAG: cellulase family glycosylhydrolase [Thermofilaceae archaeon]